MTRKEDRFITFTTGDLDEACDFYKFISRKYEDVRLENLYICEGAVEYIVKYRYEKVTY